MNIILIFTYGISLKNWEESGLLSRELKIYEQLNERYGITFTFITFGDEKDSQIIKDINYIDVIPSETIIKPSKNKLINFLKSIKLAFKLRKYIKKGDLIKTNQLNGSWIGILLKFLTKKPLLIRTGYDILQFKIYEKKPKYIILFYFLLTQFGLLFSDLFTVTSNVDKEKMRKRFINAENIIIHKNYVVKKYDSPFDSRYENKILIVGRLEKQKNYLQILNSLKNKSFEIDIVGEGFEKDVIQKKINELSLKVNLLGNISNQDLLKLYQKYRIFVSGSLYEGNPKSTLEAMASGTLVVAFENENICEVVESYKNGVTFTNFKLLPEILDEMIKNKEKFEYLTSNASKKIDEEYSLDSVIKSEIKLYNLATKSKINYSL